MKILGVKPGPIIGKTLDALFAEVESGTIPNERDALLARLSALAVEAVPEKQYGGCDKR